MLRRRTFHVDDEALETLELLAQVNKRSVGAELRAAIHAHLQRARIQAQVDLMSDAEVDDFLARAAGRERRRLDGEDEGSATA